MEENFDYVGTNSLIEEETPYVLLTFQGESRKLRLLEARKIAIALIEAAAIATAEAGILKELAPPKEKGFNPKSDRDDRMFIGLMKMIRDARMPMHPLVKPIFGQKSRTGLVTLLVVMKTVTLEPNEAKTIGQRVIEAAEAAESDLFIYQLGDELKVERKDMAVIISEFARRRQVNSFNATFDDGS